MRLESRRAPLPGLTALRFFAATYVLFFHLFPLPDSARPHPSLLQNYLFGGSTGVSCFFILSGFILAYTHPQVVSKAKFYRARFARIYPLYFLSLVLALPNFLHYTFLTRNFSRFWALTACVGLVQSWYFPLSQAINVPSWTLSCEAFFYLIFPWLVSLAWLRTRHTLRALIGIWTAQILPPVFVCLWLLPHFPSLGPGVLYAIFTPLFRVGEFLAGMLLGLAFLRRAQPALREPSARSRSVLALAFAVCALFLSVSLRLPSEVLREGWMLGPYCFLIWSLATIPNAFLASRPLQIGGEISYAVYVLFDPMGRWLYAITSRLPWHLLQNRFWIFLIYPFAWVIYTLVEKPVRNWLLRGTRHSAMPIPTPQPDLP